MDKESKTVTVSLRDLMNGAVPFSLLEQAFGPSSLGILMVEDLPESFCILRTKVLSYASYLAHLPPQELEALTDAASHYEIGWSHGKEKLASGRYDNLKGSYYLNCQEFYLAPSARGKSRGSAHVHSLPNLWPNEDRIAGFRAAVEDFCSLIIDIGVLVARACDQYATQFVEGYQLGYLENMVKTSATTKARLLHYFPPSSSVHTIPLEGASSASSLTDTASPNQSDDDADASWCATHLDDGCLTALTSALYIEETVPLPPIIDSCLPNLLSTSASPDPSAGLYIRSRTDLVVKVDIPVDCLAFQTGEALQLITAGKFKAVPHFVRGPKSAAQIARNTLAIFMQPNVHEIIDQNSGMTFGEFANISIEKHT